MASFDLKSYARRGAALRVSELNSELESIYSAFPDLRPGTGRGRRQNVVVNHEEQLTGPGASSTARFMRVEEPNGKGTSGPRKRWKMSAAQRKAVGERMRNYWAARRQAESGRKAR